MPPTWLTAWCRRNFAIWRRFMSHNCRYWILLLMTTSLTLLYGNTTAFNFTVICMQRPTADFSNGSDYGAANTNASALAVTDGGGGGLAQQFHGDQYDYTAVEKSMLFSAMAFGSLLFSPVVTVLISRFGIKRTFLACGSLCVGATLLIPLSARLGFLPLLIARVIQGAGYAIVIAMIGSVGTEWAPVSVTATYILVISTCYQLGPILAMPVSSMFCTSSFGWPYVYYFMGAVSALLLILVHFFYSERPDSKDSWASKREVAIIHAGRNPSTQAGPISELDVPYRAIITDPVVWVAMLAFFAHELAYFALTQYGPIYLHKAVGLSVKGTGWGAALPHLVSLATKFALGPINDRLAFISDEKRTMIWAAMSHVGTSLCFVALAVLPMLTNLGLVVPHWAEQAVFTAVNIFTSLEWLGVLRSTIMISGPFSHVLNAWVMMISSAGILMVPMIVGLIAPHYAVQEWCHVFFTLAAFELIGFIVFVFMCDSTPRQWAQVASSTELHTTAEEPGGGKGSEKGMSGILRSNTRTASIINH